MCNTYTKGNPIEDSDGRERGNGTVENRLGSRRHYRLRRRFHRSGGRPDHSSIFETPCTKFHGAENRNISDE